jgi:hypothetical protein
MLNSNAKYIQYKISKPKQKLILRDEDEEDEGDEEEEEEEEIEVDYNNNNSYYNYNNIKKNERKKKYFRRKTFNFILKYLLLITLIILIIEIFAYLKYFRKQQPQIIQFTQQEEKIFNNIIDNYTNINNSSGTSKTSTSLVNITSTVNYTTIKLIDYKEDLIEQENLIKYQKIDEIFKNFFNSIKQIQIETYKKQNIMINLCPAIPPKLEGQINFTQLFNNTNLADLITFYENISPNYKSDNIITNTNEEKDKITNIIKFNRETDNLNLLNENKIYGTRVSLGGYWNPPDCKSRSKIAIIIPYRDRFVHLAILLRNLHLILQRQLIDYRIFVTEQFGNKTVPFNKGRIMNAAFLEALKIDKNFQCFIFHDVDLILEDDRNMYTCPQFPRHMSVAIDKFKYHLPYYYLIGGVFQLKTEHFRLANGYSNSYWGWGGKIK